MKKKIKTIQNDRTVNVCDKCFQSSCLRGEFFCDDAWLAGTIEKKIDELKKLGLENPDYWDEEVPEEGLW